jgi:hypothetical protein
MGRKPGAKVDVENPEILLDKDIYDDYFLHWQPIKECEMMIKQVTWAEIEPGDEIVFVIPISDSRLVGKVTDISEDYLTIRDGLRYSKAEWKGAFPRAQRFEHITLSRLDDLLNIEPVGSVLVTVVREMRCECGKTLRGEPGWLYHSEPTHDGYIIHCNDHFLAGSREETARLPEDWTLAGNAREAVTREGAAREKGIARGERDRARGAAREMAETLADLVYGPDNLQDQFSPNSVKAINAAVVALDWEARQA